MLNSFCLVSIMHIRYASSHNAGSADSCDGSEPEGKGRADDLRMRNRCLAVSC